MNADLPFDRRLRRVRRDRAAGSTSGADYLHRLAANELLDRLNLVNRAFVDVLDLGCGGGYLSSQLRARGHRVIAADAGTRFARARCGVQCDEDRLAFGDGAFDLIISVGVLDSVNDLPGALVLIRRALRPDGLFLGALAGAGSLPRLKAAMFAADEAQGGATARIHPQIDVRAAGDLLSRAGFALPVADSHGITVRFPSLLSLVGDLRGMGGTNILAARSTHLLGRNALAAATANFASVADGDGKTGERFEIIYLIGWAAGPGQPRPAPPRPAPA